MRSFLWNKVVGVCRPGREPLRRHPARRPLAIEVMESRAMLSATTIEFEPQWDAFESKASFLLDPIIRQTIQTKLLEQGGYLSIQFPTDGLTAAAPNFAFTNGYELTSADGTFNVRASLSDASQRGVVFSFSDSNYTFDGDYYSNDLPPAVIIGSELSANESTDGPSTTGSEIMPAPIDQSAGSSGQGGSISINAVASALASPREFGSPAHTLVRSTVETVAEPNDALLVQGMSEDAIAGEWARAVAFETANDEDSDRPSLGHRKSLSKLIEPEVAEAVVEHSEADSATKPEVAREERAEGNRVTATESPAEGVGVPLMQIAGAIGGPWVTTSLLAPAALLQELAGANEADAEPFSPEQSSTSAMAEAFAQFAPEVSSEPQSSSVIRDLWNWTPLLLVLALERISSGNSRRSKPNAGDSVSRELNS